MTDTDIEYGNQIGHELKDASAPFSPPPGSIHGSASASGNGIVTEPACAPELSGSPPSSRWAASPGHDSPEPTRPRQRTSPFRLQ